jgi:hypothetical protein
LEPTVYASLALAGDPAADRAWMLLRSWQGKDGSWRPAAEVAVESYGTALCVTLALARGDTSEAGQGIAWLLAASGTESGFLNRAAAGVGLIESERNFSLKAWPWKPGTSSWVEPTTHALVALKKAAVVKNPGAFRSRDLARRVRMGQAMLADVRCRDGGWNYGVRDVFQVDLPSYPETTGIALVGMQGYPGLETALDYAAREVNQTISPLGRAWLTIALRLRGVTLPEIAAAPPPADLQILALEALAAADGNYRAFQTETMA